MAASGIWLKSASMAFDPVVAARDGRTHLFERFGKAHVALDAVAPHALHAHRAAGNRAGRQEIRRRRRVAFNMDAARAGVMLAGLHGERLPPVLFDRDAEAPHQVERNLDIRFADQVTHHVDGDRMLLGHQRRGHQHGSQELARYIAAHGQAVGVDVAAADAQRRIARFSRVFNLRADGVQCVDQVADRALVHARDAVQRVVAANHSQRRRQRADRRAGVPHEEVGRMHRQQAGAAGDDVGVVVELLPLDAERRERTEHDHRVVRGQQAVDGRGPGRQGGQQQSAVRDTF
jgi:hypothetical protein